MVSSLVLTVTRRCNLRCSYCPTAKDGFPSLSRVDALRALDLFSDNFGGGDIKLFGGEPLLEADTVRAVIEAAENSPAIRRVYLSTNGLGLSEDWLSFLAAQPKTILTLSLDGRPEDHRRLRRALPQVPDVYDHVQTLLPRLLRLPRLVVTQTIAPSTAHAAHDNFAHLMALGFRRFNLLPGYYLKWKREQLLALRRGFTDIAADVVACWRRGEHVYVRNLFTWAPTPFFNTGLVVDSDGSVHPNNLGLSAALTDMLDETKVGSLDEPPTPSELSDKAQQINGLLAHRLPPDVWESTQQVDHELTQFCASLYGEFAAYRRRRRAA